MSVYFLESPRELFSETMSRVAEEQSLEVSPSVELYLTELLMDSLVTSDALRSTLSEPLAVRLARAQDGELSQRFVALRELGDQVLLIQSFFPECWERRGLDSDYTTQVGTSAYLGAASLLHAPSSPSQAEDTLTLLGREFARLAGFLHAVALRLFSGGQNRMPQVVRLLERFLSTGHHQAENDLRALGLSVGRKRALH